MMRQKFEAEQYKRKLEQEFGFSIPMGVAFDNKMDNTEDSEVWEDEE